MSMKTGKNKRLQLINLAVLLILIGLSSVAWGKVAPEDLRIPDADHAQIVTLHDGSTLTGRIVSIEEDKVIFSSQVGEVTILIEKIDSIKEVAASSFKKGKYWFPNPNQTRLYFGPTGRMLKAGKGYFSDLLLFFPSVAYGITDNISIGGGISLFPGVDFKNQLYYLFPRIGYTPSEKLSLAGSIFILRLPKFDDDDDDEEDEDDLIDEPKVAGILFGTATYGTESLSLTGGVGYGYVDDDFADKPAVIIGGEWRFFRRLSFVTENWIFPGVENPLISYGFRFFGESLSADIGLFTPTGEDAVTPGIPLVSFTWNF